MLLEERCYVIYGKGFDPFKIKGYSNKNKLINTYIAAVFRTAESFLYDFTKVA